MSDAEVGEELVRLASADNFRDVTGIDEPYVASDGVPLRRGFVFRSNELQLSDADAHSVASLGVTAVYDLRHDHEVEAHPDVPVPGAEWHHLEVKGIPMGAVSDLQTREAATAVMHDVYRSFVEQPGARAAFAELLGRIADADGAQLFHCTAGKDRTGWAAALLLHVAGVDDETILADYLRTNDFSSGTREKYLGLVAEHLGADKVEVYERVMVADADYLQTAYDAAAAAYGDLDGYLRTGLGPVRRDPGASAGEDSGVTDARPAFAWRPVGLVVAVQAALLLAMAPHYGPHRDELYFVSAGPAARLGLPRPALLHAAARPDVHRRRGALAGRAPALEHRRGGGDRAPGRAVLPTAGWSTQGAGPHSHLCRHRRGGR